MFDISHPHLPAALKDIEQATQTVGFTMGSDIPTGSLLRTLTATKPTGTILELGTGTGLGTAWLLDGMGPQAKLISVDRDEQHIARRFLSSDARIQFITMDGAAFITSMRQRHTMFDLIFADMPPGKFTMLDETLDMLTLGGIYVVDDLTPIPDWEPNHAPRVAALLDVLSARTDLRMTYLEWSTGIVIATKVL